MLNSMFQSSMKFFVLDTNVLLHDPESLHVFEEHIVILHRLVLKELDKKKNEPGLVGRNARLIAKKILTLNLEAAEVVINKQGGLLVIDKESKVKDKEDHDLQLLKYCGQLSQQFPENKVVLVTKDNYLRIHALLDGVKAEDYKHDYISEVYTGCQTTVVPGEVVDGIYDAKELSALEVYDSVSELQPNEFITLVDDTNAKHTALCRLDSDLKKLKLIDTSSNTTVCGVRPINTEQQFALDALLDPNIKLVTITGATGSGKTLLSLAAGLHLVETGCFERVYVSRKEVAVDDYQGYQPGDSKQKTDPWMAGVYCCLNEISKKMVRDYKSASYSNTTELYRYYTEEARILEPIPIAYIRGTTRQGFVLIEEAQNLRPSVLKAIITRAGKNCKLVVIGDIKQIDNEAGRFIDSYNNGLSVLIEKFKNSKLHAHIALSKTVRSALANEAEKRL